MTMHIASRPTVATILIVEDEADIQELIAYNLEKAGHVSVRASNAEQALDIVREALPHLVVIDWMLPGMSGIELARLLKSNRRTESIPLILVTARGAEQDKLAGLEIGADDYMTKPFSPREFVARVRAVLRRGERQTAPADRIEAGDLVMDVPRRRTTVADRTIELTATEFAILAAMAREPGRVFTRSQLLDAVHGVAFEAYERAIDAHVKNIRRKLEPDPARPRYLLTVHGVGYRIAEPA